MKKFVFIGAYDKTDMLLYISKLLTLLGKKVLIVDTTLVKKSRYVIPTMVQEKQYVTTYEDIDIAIGFESFEAIKKYQKDYEGKEVQYDIALLDIDRAIAYQKFGVTSEDRHFFVTSFDIYNLKKGVQVLSYLKNNPCITKVYFTKKMSAEEDQYVNFLCENYSINWDKKDIVFFPFETDDLNAIYANQRSGRISMNGLSKTYIDSIFFLTDEICGEGRGKIKKAYKMMES